MGPFLFVALAGGIAGPPAGGGWQTLAVETTADFRGLSVPAANVVWVGGTKGTVGRTTDGGKTWSFGAVPGAEKLDFRDVEAFGAEKAFAMSAGPAEQSRIYRTDDGGKTWALQFQNGEPKGFLDAIAFWDGTHGIAFGDPIDGRFQLLVTDDGQTWKPLPLASRPAALPNEGAFAASGTCLVTHGTHGVWFCTGGARASRVFRSTDRGKTWAVSETPLLARIDSAGAFSLAFRSPTQGIVVGGDYRKPTDLSAAAAFTTDGGATWTKAPHTRPFRSAAAWSKDRWIVAGTSGIDASTNDGTTWKPLDAGNFNAVAFAPTGVGFAVGPKGQIARFVPGAKQ